MQKRKHDNTGRTGSAFYERAPVRSFVLKIKEKKMLRMRKIFTAFLVFAMVMILMPWVTYANRTEAATPPGNVTWQELDDNTSTDLSGYYRLERDLDIWHGWMPKEYRIVDDTYIDLNSHFCHGGGNGTLFKVSAGKKLTVHGTGWSYRSGWIKGFYRMFDLEAGATLVLDDLELSWAGGQAINGTGDNITIRLDNASIVEMYTRDDDDAAIKVKGNGLNITGSGRSRVGRSHPGAIYKSAIRVEGNDAVIRNLDIDKNTSRQDEGAGIRLKGDRCLIENCRFRDNTVETRGGAICIYGNDANIKDCTFSNNSAYDSDSSKPKDAYGNTDINKWISGEDSDSDYSGDSGGTVFIKGNNARLENLKADSSCSKSSGGTFHVWGDGSLVTDVTVDRSKSYRGGGAITLKGNNVTIDGAGLSRCMTGYQGGGGIQITGSGSSIRNVTISEGVSRGDGGGIYINGENASLQNVKLRNCQALGKGGGIALNGQDSVVKDAEVGMCKAHTGKGGGLYLAGSGQSVTGSSFYKNQAAKDQGGAVYISDDNVVVENCTFRGNEAGFIEDMVTDVSEDPVFTPVSQKIKKLNEADMYHGGAIYSDGADTKVIRSGFSENCGRDGGAVYFNRKKAFVSENTFENNAAQRDGGAIDFDAGDTYTDICVFRNNTALRYGGAIYYDSSNNILRGGQAGTFIEGNKADNARNYGHGVFVDDTDITLSGKLVIRNNNNLDTGTIADVTNDKIPTWSNLCLYKGTKLSVPVDGLISGSEVWVDSDWGHYKKPEGGYIYRGNTPWPLKAGHFRSDRAGYHFIEKNDTLYYTAGDETPDFGDMPAPRVSVEPKSGTWRKSPGRVFIDIDYNMAQADIHKRFNVNVSIDGHYPRPVEVKQTPEGRDYVELTGEEGHTYDYYFDMSYSATLPSPSGGRMSKTSESSTAEYIIEIQMMLSRVRIQSSEEESGEPVTEDLGLGREGDAFEYFGLKHPVINEGQVLTGWKLLVDGEENERDIDVEWDQEANGIRLVLPDDLDGRDIMLLPQRENKLYRVTYAMSPADFRGIDLPDNTWADHGDELTVKPLGDVKGRRSIGSQVNGVTTWGRDPYTVTVTGDTEVMYFVTDETAYMVDFVDNAYRMQNVIPTMTYGFAPVQSFTGAGFDPADPRYSMNVIDHFQVLHKEEKTDDQGNTTEEDVFNENVTLGVDDPILGPQTLKPVWVQRVEVEAVMRSDNISSEDFFLEGGYRSDSTWRATLKTGDTLRAYCLPPEGKALAGWIVYYYSWNSGRGPSSGSTDVDADTVTADGQVISEAVNPDGRERYFAQDGRLEFKITEGMKAIKSDTSLQIYISPQFRNIVTDITNVPETMDVDDIFDTGTAKVRPGTSFNPEEVLWSVDGPDGVKELDETFAPEKEGVYTLTATVPNGLGFGSDFTKTFKVNVTAHRAKQLEHVAGTEPGCVTPGMAEYYRDSESGLLYEDEKGEIQISREALVIPPAGHTEGGMTKRVKKTASCLEDGRYNAEVRCETCGELLKEELRTAPATGHDWGEWEELVAADCIGNGEEKRVCRHDETHFEIRKTKAAGHVWGEWTETKAATEEDEGEEMRICKTDPEHTEIRIIPVTGHEHGLVRVEAVAAECEKDGNTEYWICSEGERPCGRIFADPEGTREINKEDTVTFAQHSPGEAVREFELAAGCEEEGHYDEVVYCSHCGWELSRERKTIPPAGHSWDEGIVTAEPSCNGKGKKTFTCRNDSLHIMTEFTDALGHDWGEWNVTKIDPETGETEEERICKHDASHTEKRIIPPDDIDRGGDAENDDYEPQGDDTDNDKEQEVPPVEEKTEVEPDVRNVITEDRAAGSTVSGNTVTRTTTGAPTGDRSSVYIWIAVAAAAAGLTAVAVYLRKRKN